MTPALVGYMPMPAGFPYADVFRRGRPRHGQPGKYATYDAFYAKHPPMKTSHRAKIFAPFDALRGFNEAVAAKEVQYVEKAELTESEKEELDRKTKYLEQAAANARKTGDPAVSVSITYFEKCEDPENEGYGKKGRYRTVTGCLQKVDFLHRTILLDKGSIDVDDIYEIRCPPIYSCRRFTLSCLHFSMLYSSLEFRTSLPECKYCAWL